MESMVNNENRIDYGKLSLFVSDFIKSRKNQESNSWRSEFSMISKDKWSLITTDLSKFLECKKIVKTKDSGIDTILFISDIVSTSFVESVMECYTSLLFSSDEYFDILVLNDEEYLSWQNNENNIVFWERADA